MLLNSGERSAEQWLDHVGVIRPHKPREELQNPQQFGTTSHTVAHAVGYLLPGSVENWRGNEIILTTSCAKAADWGPAWEMTL